jgi:L-2-hydroxyglutarate oxidase LhgO
MDKEADFLVIGAGILGLSVARELSGRYHDSRIVLIEKEARPAEHASGRNSGVLHAGLYYPENTLKARFTVEGNRTMTEYCLEHGLPINRCGKVVVARNQTDLETLHELRRRGEAGGVELELLDEKGLAEVEPNAKTHGSALYSPSTSTVSPLAVCRHIESSLSGSVMVSYSDRMVGVSRDTAVTSRGRVRFRHAVNCAGLYADKVAGLFGAGRGYAIVPFKGLYAKYEDETFLRRHVYPVPDLSFPFLGVHFTIGVDGSLKIGPNAAPAFWRENYSGLSRFSVSESFQAAVNLMRLYARNSGGFRKLVAGEVGRRGRRALAGQAAGLVRGMDESRIGRFLAPGIRAQLVDVRRSEMVMDFLIEQAERSTHVLNAVSPGFTCAPVFARHIVDGIRMDS